MADAKAMNSEQRCQECNGTGEIVDFIGETETCEECDGTGVVNA